MSSSSTSGHAIATSGRIGLFDVLRGLSVISMVLFHLCYDLRFLAGVQLDWFAPPFQDIWRASISWTFLFVAGCMCSQSRSNLRRGLKYGAVAIAIFVVTYVAAVDTPISFGIIFCMAACTLVTWVLQKANALPCGFGAALVLFACFVLLLPVSSGYMGVGPLEIHLPQTLYQTEWFSWLGFPGPRFASGDYYPLLPYLMIYLSGATVGARLAKRGYPDWAQRCTIAPLNFVGRHALPIYVLHQPILLVLTGVAFT